MPRRRLDCEVYRDYFLCRLDNPPQDFQLIPGGTLDIAGLRRELTCCQTVGFNSNNYDAPMVSAALQGWDNWQLKQLSDAIILRNLKPWDLEREYGVPRMQWDHIDLIEVAPGQASLKAYGGKMHAKKLQDLPIEPSASISWPDRVNLREYCQNDLDTTLLLEQAMSAQLTLREEMSATYGVDLRSRSDAQIAEDVMKATLPFKVQRPSVSVGATFHYRPPPWMQFVHQPLLELLARCPFRITDTGGVEMPAELARTTIRIGQSAYKMGIGGLHSTEQSVTWRATDDWVVRDSDVASYYPSLIIKTGIYPPQIGPVFQEIYQGWFDTRMKAKHAGDKKKANTYKLFLNSVFGKTGSQYSIFYAPSEMLQVTIGGQLALLMLIERLELCGIPVISANTDGIVTYCRRDQLWLRDQCISWWEQTTGFTMEHNDYRILAQRDVNSYVAITMKGEVKLKGAYAPPEPGASGWPNPTTQVCVDAVVAYLRDGVPLAATILSCRDVRQFVSVRNVKGGGTWNGGYLGKVVRWYYASGMDTAPIIYKLNGNKVAKTDGCRPLMELPDALPDDIDYRWYVAEARQLLLDTGTVPA